EALARQAAAQSDQSQAQLEAAIAGTRPERLRASEAALAAAEAQREGANVASANAARSYEERFTYRTNLAVAEQAAEAATARVAQAQAQLDLALAGQTDEVINAARGDLQAAEASEKAAAKRLDDTVIRAPSAGAVAEIILRAGESCTPGSVVVRLIEREDLWVKVYLSTVAVTGVRVGQRAEVRVDAYPDRVFEGGVLAISDEAEFTPKNAQTVDERIKQVFWVKIGVGDGEGLLKPGLPADVRLPEAVPETAAETTPEAGA
ncbi:MAG TPA: hypothetical protein DCZ72_00580, partial [Armatimonadetes bacterium]|nr:hypothetical protein [Armatimonadota bacterium]